jgi:hypothetical protein
MPVTSRAIILEDLPPFIAQVGSTLNLANVCRFDAFNIAVASASRYEP